MVNTSYEEILEMVVSELTERGIKEQQEESAEIKAMLKGQAELSVMARECLAKLDAGIRHTLVRYYEQAEAIADAQIHHLYIQGAKDCVRLLKSLGVI
ncbi:MAG: hypothetical protein LBS19_09505 [Clostridiales bacterium]|jgi:hypothetical protein|nr:hypothetical protein [Clostridiales bacterium]